MNKLSMNSLQNETSSRTHYSRGCVTSKVPHRNTARLGASMIMEGSWFQAIIVRGKKENV